MKKVLYELIHTFILISLAALGYYFGLTATGVLVGSSYLLGRELAQAEYRWIEHYGKGLRANMPYWGALDPKVWNLHSFFFNLTLPIGVGLVILGLLQYYSI